MRPNSRPRCAFLLLGLLLGVSLGVALPLADAARKRTYVYVHDSADNGRVFGFRLASDGTLTKLPASPFITDDASTGCSGQCQTMAYSNKRKVLLTTNDAGITAWLVAKGGALTEVPGSPFVAPEAIGVAVVEIKKRAFVYAARNAGAITGFEIEKDGTLTPLPGLPFAVGSDLIGATSAGNALLVIDEGEGAVFSYRVGKDGTLTEAGTSPLDFTVGESAYSVHTGSKGKFAITGGGLSLFVARLNKKTGAITALPGDPLELAVFTSNGPAVSPKGLLAVIRFGQDASLNDVQIVKLNKKTGELTPLGDVQTLGMSDVSVYAWDLKGKHVVAASRENDQVRTFAVHRKTGTVTQVDQAVIPDAGNTTDIEVLKR